MENLEQNNIPIKYLPIRSNYEHYMALKEIDEEQSKEYLESTLNYMIHSGEVGVDSKYPLLRELYEDEGLENKELPEFRSFDRVMRKLGQTQYSSVFVNPNPRAHEDGTPYFDDIRIEGDPDDWYSFKIHKDDVEKFIRKWFEYKKATSPFFLKEVIEDYLPKE